MDNKLNILICDDNIAVHESLGAYLHAEQINCTSVYDGEAALEQLKKESYDLLILDIMMPKMFGTDVCKEIRRTNDIPIIMLSARSEEIDRIIGLELGADDYVTKPFSPREVVTRIKTILKRMNKQPTSKKIVIADMTIDMEKYSVTIANTTVDLTAKEIETLACLAQHEGKVLTREQLLNAVWGYDYYGDTRVVDTQIKRIRKKLPSDGAGFTIKAIYGVGYMVEILE